MFCHQCGKELLDNAKFCSHCGNISYADNNSKKFINQDYKVSTIWKRFLNYIVDYILIFILSLTIFLIFDFGDSGSFLIFFIMIVYYVFFESIWQKTPGKFITKTKVIKKDGTKPNFLSILGRTFSRFIPFDNLSFLFSSNPIGWHDSISKTMIVPSSYTSEDVKKIDFDKKAPSSNIIVIIVIIFVFIAIIGLLSTLAVVSLNSARSKARDAKRISDIRQISTLLELYHTDNNTYVNAYNIGPIKTDTSIWNYSLSEIKEPSATADTPNCSSNITDKDTVCNYAITALTDSNYEICFYMENDGDNYSRGVNNIKPGNIISSGCFFDGTGKPTDFVKIQEINSDENPSMGTDNPVMVIEEFASFDDPYSATFYPILRRFVVDNGDLVELVFRDFPIDDNNDVNISAHLAANCAFEQDKFWEMHDKLFDNRNNITKSLINKFAKDIDLDIEKFNACFLGERYSDNINKDREDGINSGVDGTPTVFINGEKFSGVMTRDILDQILESVQSQ